MGAMASQITSLTIVYSTVHSDADKKHQSSASLAFVRGIYRGPVNSPHKWPVTGKMFPFDDVIIVRNYSWIFHVLTSTPIWLTQFRINSWLCNYIRLHRTGVIIYSRAKFTCSVSVRVAPGFSSQALACHFLCSRSIIIVPLRLQCPKCTQVAMVVLNDLFESW